MSLCLPLWPWLAGRRGSGLGQRPARSRLRWWRRTCSVPRRRSPDALMRLSAELGPDAVMGRNSPRSGLAVSPDGTRLVFRIRGADGKVRLGVRLFDQGEVTTLAGTEGGMDPFFSPDGQSIAFFADGKLKKIAAQGGVPVTLCDAPVDLGGSWGDDGNIIAALSLVGGLSRIPSAGGAPSPVTVLQPGERRTEAQLAPGPSGKPARFCFGLQHCGRLSRAEHRDSVFRQRRTEDAGGRLLCALCAQRAPALCPPEHAVRGAVRPPPVSAGRHASGCGGGDQRCDGQGRRLRLFAERNFRISQRQGGPAVDLLAR